MVKIYILMILITNIYMQMEFKLILVKQQKQNLMKLEKSIMKIRIMSIFQ